MSEEIKAKLIKLLNVTTDRGASEAEAATAMSMATRLMIAHGISQDELRQSAFVAGRSEQTQLDHDWQELCAGAAGELMGCVTIISTNRMTKDRGFYFVGRPENHKAAGDLFNYLADQVERFYKINLVPGMTQSARANFRRTFKFACASRVRHRAAQLVQEMKRGELKVSEGSTALVVQGHFDKLRDEADEFLKNTVKLDKPKKARPRAGGIGTNAGLMAGNSVNLRGAIR